MKPLTNGRMRKSKGQMRIFAGLVAAAFLMVAGSVFAADGSAKPGFFTNPVVANGADPWVISWKGDYLYCRSGGGGISVSRSGRLQDLGTGTSRRVWTPPEKGEYSRNVWAPELHYLHGHWFIYFAADDGDNRNHRMFVLEGTGQDPQAPFVLKGKVTSPTDRWAIDGTVLELPGDRLFFIWSGWEGTNNVAQNLYIAPMSDPRTISGERVLISRPEHDWEQHGRPWVNEGPQVLRKDNRVFIIYSASGSWTDDYCLGHLALTGDNPLEPRSWVKHPRPVFARTEKVFGPGHGSFVKSRDGREDWIVYHAAQERGSGWRRDIRMQPFGWNTDGTPRFGEPVAPGVWLPEPGGDSGR